MGKLLEQFEAYYNSISPEQRKSDFQELAKYNRFGPRALNCIKKLKKYG